MLVLGVRVLLLFLSPFFMLSFVPICMLFPAPAYDVINVNTQELTKTSQQGQGTAYK
jgi:hypothetical protein